jgi:hypothetical protein
MGELISERIKRNARELKLLGLAESADELVDRTAARCRRSGADARGTTCGAACACRRSAFACA